MRAADDRPEKKKPPKKEEKGGGKGAGPKHGVQPKPDEQRGRPDPKTER